ncbi:MAG: formylglycine-generating enzyme family protein [Anaerolineae bacterium]|nr:formylglycine-generating enzyme family protein [Anaerolineae bacterium]
MVSEVERLLKIIANPDIEPKIRADAGDRLAELGDPRPGVGLRPDGIPNIDWVEIPAGEFIFGGDEKAIDGLPRQYLYLDTFSIARYPVTYAQFQAFVEAEDGIQNDQWWQGLAWEQKRVVGSEWPIANRPCENVSWYQAMAFCRWLSAKVGYTVSLPTEQQWEKAARGTDGRFYPWGNEYINGYANVNETWQKAGPYWLQQTTAVGIYPQDASPYGVMDMAGNVIEWTMTAWTLKNIYDDRDAIRVLRGASWNAYYLFARSDARLKDVAYYWHEFFGFRLVCERI